MIETAPDFYDNISGFYDSMTRFERRIAAVEKSIRQLTMQFDTGTIADVACGTGVHAIALGRMGYNVIGFDASERMIALARQNARRFGVNTIRFEQGEFQSPKILTSGPFALILCLGNSLPHIASQRKLAEILASWKSALSKGGGIVLELLNYDIILETQNRLIGVTVDSTGTIIRFYDFTSPRLTFNILRLTTEENKPHVEWHATPLTPFRVNDIIDAAKQAGYTSTLVYSSLTQEEWTTSSKNTVLFLRP